MWLQFLFCIYFFFCLQSNVVGLIASNDRLRTINKAREFFSDLLSCHIIIFVNACNAHSMWWWFIFLLCSFFVFQGSGKQNQRGAVQREIKQIYQTVHVIWT